MKRFLIGLLVLSTLSVSAQIRKPNRNVGGQFSLGVRNTTSLFGHDDESVGMGFGGQFRIRLYDFLNTEWYADYLTSGIGSIGNRTDYHIGWSVMFYSPKKRKYKSYRPKPYLIAGHCFDYTRISGNNLMYQSNASAERWSSAVQAGLGMHIPFSERIDISLAGQYMMHLGKDIHAETRTAGNGDQFLFVEPVDEAGLEGHLLVTVSLNIRIADLWADVRGPLGEHEPMTPEDQEPQIDQ